MSDPDGIHIAIPQLWAYAKTTDPATLSDAEWTHLQACEQCIGTVWICNTSDSIGEVQIKLKSQHRFDPV
jgi:hypothetical protein